MIGRKLAHYRIVEKVGADGRGEVYRARDEKLQRDVALKILPAGTLGDESHRIVWPIFPRRAVNELVNSP